MQNYKLINRVMAAVAFLFSFIIYLSTIAPSVSFWDCGEFITCSYILGIPHPPGAPFYLLIGRIFTMLPLAADIALRVNIISALTSALTVMLTFLIIVRLVKQWRGEPKNLEDILILTASGLIGAMAFAFTDSFWFNAVEAEVYAISMFFTSFIFWLILVWLEKAEEPGSERYLLFIAYMIGLAIGVHLEMILVLPAIGMIVYFKYLDKKQQPITLQNILIFSLITAGIFVAIYPGVVQWIPRIAGALTLWSLLLFVIVLFFGIYWAINNGRKILSLAFIAGLLIIVGYSTYSMIYIRSGLDPAIDENDPETVAQMVKYLNREQYGTWGTFPRRYPGLPQEWEFKERYSNMSYWNFNFSKQMDFMWNYQIKKMYLRYFAWQFIGQGATIGSDGFISENFSFRGLLGLPFLIGLIGMIHHFYRHWRHALSIAAIFVLTGVAIVIYLNQENPQPRERDYVFVGSFFAFAIWIGMGLTAILEWIQEAMRNKEKTRKLLYGAVIVSLLIMAPINLLANNYRSHDRTGEYVAYDYSYNILQTCEPNAVVFTNGDNDTFPLWFLQYVYNIRPDIRVVNLSLLNTPWYIKQLKNEEPKVPISLTNEQIDQLEGLIPWQKRTIKLPVPRSVQEKMLDDLGERRQFVPLDEQQASEIVFDVQPTVYGQAIRVQDYMILNILYANQWRKPVYFAVTVSNDNQLNLQKYFRMDGLDFKLVPYDGQHISTSVLEHHLFEIFKFRGLNDPSVFLNDNIIGLLQNYRAAYLRLAREYLLEKKYDKMLAVLDKMEETMPEKTVPVPDYRISMSIGQMYYLAGRSDEFIRRLDMALEQNPESPDIYGALISILSQQGNHERAVKTLELWLAKHPDDKQAKDMLERERTFLANRSDSAKMSNVTPAAGK
jgi:tetratricopeptide (TPR) repeat protein